LYTIRQEVEVTSWSGDFKGFHNLESFHEFQRAFHFRWYKSIELYNTIHLYVNLTVLARGFMTFYEFLRVSMRGHWFVDFGSAAAMTGDCASQRFRSAKSFLIGNYFLGRVFVPKARW